MPIPHGLLEDALKKAERPLVLTEKFKDYLEGGKLVIDKFDFSQFSDVLEDIDFNNCILRHCDFSYLALEDCNFNGAQASECRTQGMVAVGTDLPDELRAQFNLPTQQSIISDALARVGFFAPDRDEMRIEKWMLHVIARYPGRFLTYAQLCSYAQLRSNPDIPLSIIKIKDGFLHITNPAFKLSDEGWKLHISVDPKDIERAFDIAAPLLFRLFPNFKVIDINTDNYRALSSAPDEKLTGLHLREKYGRQITVYFGTGESIQLSNTKAIRAFLEQINKLFHEKSIKPGKIPASDAKIDSYFSVRNDMGLDQEYLSAEQVGAQYNPLNRKSPLLELLEEKTAPFSPKLHLQRLPIDTPSALKYSCELTTIALVSEYIDFNLLSLRTLKENKERLLYFHKELSEGAVLWNFIKNLLNPPAVARDEKASSLGGESSTATINILRLEHLNNLQSKLRIILLSALSREILTPAIEYNKAIALRFRDTLLGEFVTACEAARVKLSVNLDSTEEKAVSKEEHSRDDASKDFARHVVQDFFPFSASAWSMTQKILVIQTLLTFFNNDEYKERMLQECITRLQMLDEIDNVRPDVLKQLEVFYKALADEGCAVAQLCLGRLYLLDSPLNNPELAVQSFKAASTSKLLDLQQIATVELAKISSSTSLKCLR
jgi:hypothetical protein